MKKTAIFALAMSFVMGTASAANFTDIENHWAKNSITALAEIGIVDGVTDTEFVPDGIVTRAQYLKMIMEATGVKEQPVRYGECLDADGTWYGTYVQGALDCGVMPEAMVANYKESVDYKVDEDGKATETKVIYTGEFNGDAPITREEMAVLTQYMYQYTRTILTNKEGTIKAMEFGDAGEISDWAKASVTAAVANGFIEGMDENMFQPKGTATRAQAATVILRVLNK